MDNYNCPQYVDFTSESFLGTTESQAEDAESNLSLQHADSPKQETEGSDHSDEYDSEPEPDDEQPQDVKENFPVHRRKDASVAESTSSNATVPRPFRFATDKRFGVKAQKSSRLEAASISSGKTKLRVTVPEPFNLSKPTKKVNGEPYIPLAEKVNAFERKTPERFHSTAPQAEFRPQSHWSPQRVVAKTPKLRAGKRQRPLVTMSQEERNEKELAEMKSYKFHAQPLDPKIYGEHSRAKPLKESPKKEQAPFKARPVPKGILNGPTGLKRKQTVPLTNPKSPSFMTKDRLTKRRKFEQNKSKLSIVKGRRDSKASAERSRLKIQKPADYEPLRPTVVEPFSFDLADRKRLMEKENWIQQKLTEKFQPSPFKAQPLPSLTPTKLPPVEKKSSTVPEPFHLTEPKNMPIVENTKPVNFKANPATVLTKDPFVPEKSKKPPVEIQEFTLHTEKRASEHVLIQREKEAREAEREEILSKQREAEERREQEQIKQLRREMVHTAQPIRSYKNVIVQPSDKPLTVPKTPDFSTKKT